MTEPIVAVDAAVLEAVARGYALLREELTRFGTLHQSSPPVDQPSATAVSVLTASADHAIGTCADHLIGFAESVVAAARMYESTDSAGAQQLSAEMPN